jgi:hypothetical protein
MYAILGESDVLPNFAERKVFHNLRASSLASVFYSLPSLDKNAQYFASGEAIGTTGFPTKLFKERVSDPRPKKKQATEMFWPILVPSVVKVFSFVNSWSS